MTVYKVLYTVVLEKMKRGVEWIQRTVAVRISNHM